MRTTEPPPNLVERCREGDLAAFSELFNTYQARVYRLSLTILQNEQDAEDAVQDVFIRLFAQIRRFRGEARFTTWLTSIVVNSCRDKLRRRKVRRVLALDWLRNIPDQQDVPQAFSDQEDKRRLWQAINRLDEKHRLPLILHYHERLPCQEVARILGVRVSTVYSRLNTARTRLRVDLDAAESAGRNQPAFFRHDQ